MDRKFSQLTENTTLALNDIFASTDVSATQSKRVNVEIIFKAVDALSGTAALAQDSQLLALNTGPTPIKVSMQDVYNFVNILSQYDNPALNDFIPSFEAATGATKKVSISDILKTFNLLNAVTSIVEDDSMLIYDQSNTGIRKISPRNFMKIINRLTTRTTTSTSDYLPVYQGGSVFRITPFNLLKGIQQASTISSIASADYLYVWDSSASAPKRITAANFLKYINDLTDLGTGIANGDYFVVRDATDGNAKKVQARYINPPNSITSAHLQTNSVGSSEIQNNAVGNSEIAAAAITNNKIVNVDAGKIDTGTLDVDRLPSSVELTIGTYNDTPSPNDQWLDFNITPRQGWSYIKFTFTELGSSTDVPVDYTLLRTVWDPATAVAVGSTSTSNRFIRLRLHNTQGQYLYIGKLTNGNVGFYNNSANTVAFIARGG